MLERLVWPPHASQRLSLLVAEVQWASLAFLVVAVLVAVKVEVKERWLSLARLLVWAFDCTLVR